MFSTPIVAEQEGSSAASFNDGFRHFSLMTLRGFGGFGGNNLPSPKMFTPPSGKPATLMNTPKVIQQEEEFVLPEMDDKERYFFNNFRETFERSLDNTLKMGESGKMKCLWHMFNNMPDEYLASFVRKPMLRNHPKSLFDVVAQMEEEVIEFQKKVDAYETNIKQ